MKAINFPDSNFLLGDGGNQNTHSIPAMKCFHPQYHEPVPAAGESGPVTLKHTRFIAAKFEFDEKEKQDIRSRFADAMSEFCDENGIVVNSPEDEKLLNSLMACLPQIYLNCMHGFVPVIMSVDSPLSMGYKRVETGQQN